MLLVCACAGFRFAFEPGRIERRGSLLFARLAACINYPHEFASRGTIPRLSAPAVAPVAGLAPASAGNAIERGPVGPAAVCPRAGASCAGPSPPCPACFNFHRMNCCARRPGRMRWACRRCCCSASRTPRTPRRPSAYARNGIVQQAVRLLKKELPHLLVITDVCLCEYMEHGHCGIVRSGQVRRQDSQ